MDELARGLRFRLRRASRRIAEQHAHLAELQRELEAALAAGRRGELAGCFARYRDALEAHFGLEEEVFFPALHGQHPERAPELESLSAEHRNFAAALERLHVRLSEGRVAAFERGFAALEKEVGVHEEREERLVRTLAEGR